MTSLTHLTGHAIHGTLTLSAADSPVRISAMPDAEPDSPEPEADYFSRPFAWFDNSDPASCCWRTWQRCLLEGWTLFSESWGRSGMTRNGTAYRLRPLVPRISGTGFSLLPTPNQWDGMRGAESRETKTKRGAGGVNLREAVKTWPAPTSRDYKGGRSSEATQERNSRPLNEVIESQAASGSLNPEWVEWLMGFPVGWTDLGDSETQ